MSIEEEDMLEKYEELLNSVELSAKNSIWVQFNNHLKKL